MNISKNIYAKRKLGTKGIPVLIVTCIFLCVLSLTRHIYFSDLENTFTIAISPQA